MSRRRRDGTRGTLGDVDDTPGADSRTSTRRTPTFLDLDLTDRLEAAAVAGYRLRLDCPWCRRPMTTLTVRGLVGGDWPGPGLALPGGRAKLLPAGPPGQPVAGDFVVAPLWDSDVGTRYVPRAPDPDEELDARVGLRCQTWRCEGSRRDGRIVYGARRLAQLFLGLTEHGVTQSVALPR